MELDVGGSNPPGCTKIMKKKISRPPVELPAGFVDRKEKDLVIRDFLIKQIRETMTKYGFEYLETHRALSTLSHWENFYRIRIVLQREYSHLKMERIGYL